MFVLRNKELEVRLGILFIIYVVWWIFFGLWEGDKLGFIVRGELEIFGV